MNNTRGFTLIELLVVIAIIAILAGMMFPVLAGAKESGRRAACTTHLSEIGKALRMYCDDNGARLPWATAWYDKAAPDYATDPTFVGLKLLSYTKNSIAVWHCPSIPSTLSHPVSGMRNGYYYYNAFCPQGSLEFASAYDYAYFHQLAGVPIDGPYEFSLTWVMYGNPYTWRNTRASKVPAVWDQQIWRLDASGQNLDPLSNRLSHNDGANILFLDLHVKWHSQNDGAVYLPEKPWK